MLPRTAKSDTVTILTAALAYAKPQEDHFPL